MLKKKPEPSFEDRLNAANAKAGAALSIFEQAAVDLENAAREKDFVANEVADKQAALRAELDRLGALEAEALYAADTDYNTAAKIRAFVGN
jgi:hypothetical protein